MTHVTTPSMIRQIESLFDGGSVAGLSDRQLLDRFVDRRDPAAESAFAAMVRRHGPMVLAVCQQLLDDRHLAEDAFQAVFLTLARKAGSIRDPDRLGAWLYGVAVRTARKSQARLIRQRRGEGGKSPNAAAVEPTAPPADQPAIDREQAEALHDEIDRLPGAFRLLVVLCYFEGLTLDEAALRLSWPEGTVRSRLARRGTSSAAASPDAASSCPPPPWPRSSTRGPPRRRSHPPCATIPPAPRSTSRPDTPRRPWPWRCCDPCCSTS